MKRLVYIVSWIVLGVLLSFIVHAGIEIPYIYYAIAHAIPLTTSASLGHAICFLPAWLQSVLLFLGAIGGYFAGVYFWRVLYVEKRYKKWGTWRKLNLKESF